MTEFSWTEDRVAELIRRWDEGETGGQIAKSMKAASRNAVLGKVDRLKRAGHVFLRTPRDEDPVTRVRIAKMGGAARWASHKVAKTHQHNLRAVNAARRAASKNLPLPEAKALVDATHAKPWTERKFGECAYPISGEGADTFSCCAPTRKSYCKAHQRVMFYRPSTPTSGLVRLAQRAAA